MSTPLEDIASYSAFVYALRERHPFVTGSTLTLAPIGATLARLEGRIEYQGGIHLEVWELVDFAVHRIRTYSYEVYRGDEKICWYDAWEHPEFRRWPQRFPTTSTFHQTCVTTGCLRPESALPPRIWALSWRMSGGIGFNKHSAVSDGQSWPVLPGFVVVPRIL